MIEDAIRQLEKSDWHRLRRVAAVLATKVPTMDAEALLFEALERTLDGRRRWRREAVDFVGHLIGVMRSVASHEANKRGLRQLPLPSSIELIGPAASPESALSAEQQIRQLRAHFSEREDTEALEVLDAMELGCDGATIRAQMSLTTRQLETIVRRIRRSAHKILPRG